MSNSFSVSLRAAVLTGICACLPTSGVVQAEDSVQAPKSVPAIGLNGLKPAKLSERNATPIGGDGHASTSLTLDLRKYDFEGTKANNRMYMPEASKLSLSKPAEVTKEPKYAGTRKYAQVTIGNGTPNRFTLVSEEIEGQEPRIYLDLNGDGDLTNDNTGNWQTKKQGNEGSAPSYSGTWAFTPAWKSASGEVRGEYALNFYWQPGRGQLNYYSASARVGKISVDGKTYDVTLIENDSDGVFNKLYDPNKPIVVGERQTKPVWLLLDGDQFDIRGTFPFGGLNYLATVYDDGSTLDLKPKMKVVQPPRPTSTKVTALQAGVEAPDFEALVWKAGQTKIDTSNRVKLSDFRGKKIVVVDMWATWCGPCMKGIPHLSKVAEAVRGQDVEVIALNTSDEEEPFEQFANGKGRDYKFTLARDPAGRDENGNTIARRLYGVTGIPATFVIDKTGKIVGTVSGYSEGDTKLEQILKGLGVKVD